MGLSTFCGVTLVIFSLQWEKSLASAVAEKNKEIAVRDEKLSRLKSQMADAMRGSSW